MKAFLVRLLEDDKQTLGMLLLFKGENKIFECKTLELPWLNNQPYVSCIPTGAYNVRKHYSSRLGESFHVFDVPGRSEILIHAGNYRRDTLGCILLGMRFADIDNDGMRDIESSGIALEHLLSAAPDEFTLTIS